MQQQSIGGDKNSKSNPQKQKLNNQVVVTKAAHNHSTVTIEK